MIRFKKIIVIILVLSGVASAVLFSASAASTVATGAGVVSCDLLNIRANADKSSAVVGMVAHGDYVVILDKPSADWYHVSAYGTVGYVASLYLTGVEAAKNFTATGKLNGSDIRMRGAPSTSGDILGTYQSGASMSVIGINSGWYKVKYDGKTGYVRSDFLELTGGATTAAAVTGTAAAAAKPAAQTPAQTEGEKIATFAKQFNGYPYVYGAESPSEGFDCSGLCYYVYGHFGYTIERRASLQYADNGVSVPQAQLQPGDLVFFGSGGEVCHVGMYIGNRNFVHACDSSTGVIISTLDSGWGTTSWIGAKRIVR